MVASENQPNQPLAQAQDGQAFTNQPQDPNGPLLASNGLPLPPGGQQFVQGGQQPQLVSIDNPAIVKHLETMVNQPQLGESQEATAGGSRSVPIEHR